MLIVTGNCCLVDEDVVRGVVAIDEAVLILNVKPFNGFNHSSSFVSYQVQKDVLHLLRLSCDLIILR